MRYATILLALLLCGGCMREIIYTHYPDGRIEARYRNTGFDTSIDGLTIHKSASGVDVQVSKFNSEAKVAQATAEAALEWGKFANKVKP